MNPIEKLLCLVGSQNDCETVNENIFRITEEEFSKVSIAEWKQCCKHTWEVEELVAHDDNAIDQFLLEWSNEYETQVVSVCLWKHIC